LPGGSDLRAVGVESLHDEPFAVQCRNTTAVIHAQMNDHAAANASVPIEPRTGLGVIRVRCGCRGQENP
jgi:hypothetical protein